MGIASVSHVVFATIMITIGIVGLIKGDFTPVWDPTPQDSHALAYLCSFISLATGIGLLWQRTAAAAARALFASLLLWLLLLRVPNIILSPTFGVFWPGFETAVMVAGSWVLYTWFAADWDRQRLGFVTGKWTSVNTGDASEWGHGPGTGSIDLMLRFHVDGGPTLKST